MDPEATITELRALVRGLETSTDVRSDAARIGELFEALDGWLSRGGFLPADWKS